MKNMCLNRWNKQVAPLELNTLIVFKLQTAGSEGAGGKQISHDCVEEQNPTFS